MERNATGRNIPVMGVQQETSGLYANQSSRIVTGGKVRAAKRLPRKSHTCSMGLPANPYVQYPHSLIAVRQLLCDDMVHCRP
ncbi:hypothetical protein TNCV_429551 [Trichonephila clavipes]|nr:hypothetical protein TNCV_429551 [Trichonephila clavipes]